MKKPRILMIDIGGSNVKVMRSGGRQMRKFPSGRKLTPQKMVRGVKEITQDWPHDAISIGFPGLVEAGKLVREPINLGNGWMRFDFARAFRKPVRLINDAAMQALANYKDGRMLFVGLGTSVGAAIVADGVIVPVELGLIPLTEGDTFMSRLAKVARKRDGQKRWQKAVHQAMALLRDVFWPSDTVIGGGNAKHLHPLPKGCRRSSNRAALRGAERLWKGADLHAEPFGTTVRIKDKGKGKGKAKTRKTGATLHRPPQPMKKQSRTRR
ncbi:MAG: ROK family protein [Prosthecobacter sp.]